MPTDDPQKILADEILQEARHKADEILAAARAQAEKIISQARDTANSETEKILAEHRARAAKRAEMTLRMVDQQVARGKLHGRDTAIQATLDQAAAQCAQLSGEAYREAVVRLAAAAAQQMPAGDLVAKVTAVPGTILDEASLSSDIAAAAQKDGKTPNVRAQVQPGPLKGVVVESVDGRLRWDNTFDARLRRLRSGLRRLAIPILFEEA
jgi:V/A-type H+-transporting ATPase subunit E